MKKKARKHFIILIVMTVVILACTGCRPSPALEQIIYTETASVVDVNHEKLKQDQRHEDSEEDEDFNDDNKGDDSGNTDASNVNENNGGSVSNTKNTIGTGTGGSGKGKQTNYSEKDGSNGTASGKNKADSDAKSGGKSKTASEEAEEGDGGLTEYTPEEEEDNPADAEEEEEEENSGGNGDSENQNGNGSGGGNESQPDPGSEGNSGNGEGGDAPTKTIDYGGQEQSVPTNADKVAASGYAAQLVEMLGGNGRLIGADEAFTSSWLASWLCSDFGSIGTWWHGNGSGGMDDAQLAALLEAKPNAVIEVSGSGSLTGGQIEQIRAALGEDSYVVIPEPSSMANLINGAKIVATVLTDSSSGSDAMKIAEKYESWINGVASDVNAGDSYVFSTYVADWHDDVGYTFTRGNFGLLPAEADPSGSGYGVATGYSASAPYPVTELMGMASVTNEAAATGSEVSEWEVYLTPMFRNLAATYQGAYRKYNGSLPVSADWGLVHQNGDVLTRLGEENFQTVIAENNYVRNMLIGSWYWQWHGTFNTSNGVFNYAYVPDGTAEVFWSSISGGYTIQVNPVGLGNWAKGSVDSPLEAYWVSCVIRGDMSTDSLYARIREFYEQFFGVSLTNDQIAGILGGE